MTKAKNYKGAGGVVGGTREGGPCLAAPNRIIRGLVHTLQGISGFPRRMNRHG